MTEREIEQLPDIASGVTLRIVERSGNGFCFFVLERPTLPLFQVTTRMEWDSISVNDTLDEAREDAKLVHLSIAELRSVKREYVKPREVGLFSSPWGAPDYAYDYGEGVIKLGTPGHGGFFLTLEANERIHPAWRTGNGFYEEDEQWGIVAHHFPHLFTTRDRTIARRTLINSFPDEFMKVTGEALTADQSHTLRQREFWATNAQNWLVDAAFGVADQDVKVVASLGGRRESNTQRWFLVPANEYKPSLLPFVIDLDRHVEILDASQKTFHPKAA
ncbi:DUF7007 domain-containing protein [Microvirga tunisiensis]|uniref:DUF7007 domain-containing protein n=1 Tax=Microvirga tunisiensis TaxID=2108360 RepID=A0A5N7MQ89_9HYPH|nr:hypothetical protein [Microvirga tunisiensis]MPR11494.1 hypothetical protein [Microvirga tunisiensis]MPR28619.1 hypothetical protein [Microvirga tunisiensis]